jgi:hypothetical protein
VQKNIHLEESESDCPAGIDENTLYDDVDSNNGGSFTDKRCVWSVEETVS